MIIILLHENIHIYILYYTATTMHARTRARTCTHAHTHTTIAFVQVIGTTNTLFSYSQTYMMLYNIYILRLTIKTFFVYIDLIL